MASRRKALRSDVPDDRMAAAQYLRMSTEHQKYSIENQAEAITQYATARGLTIVRSYEDAGRSGLRLVGRLGLQSLIADVQNGNADFSTILVYDVSRWGRFQDSDESAYYEFICKAAGISVRYCAEQFDNDGSLSAGIFKALKRAMAAEYSRELSAKVFAGQCRLIKLGFRQGGRAGYGLRRQLINEHGEPKMLLNHREYKSLATDRVILVPGPQAEIDVVRRIYRLFTVDRRFEREIAEILNQDGMLNVVGRPWTERTVFEVLTNEKYIGNNVFSRRSTKLRQSTRKLPPNMWVRKEGAFQAIIDIETFRAAEKVIGQRVWNLSDDEILTRLRTLLHKKGRLSADLIDGAADLPSHRTYFYRFGGLRRAYEKIDYRPSRTLKTLDTRGRQRAILAQSLDEIRSGVERVGGTVSIESHQFLKINDEFTVKVTVLPSRRTKGCRFVRWWIELEKSPQADILIVLRMDDSNSHVADCFLLPWAYLETRTVHFTPPVGASLSGYRFENLMAFYECCARQPI